MTRPVRFLAVVLLAALPGCALLGDLAHAAFEPPKLDFVSWAPEALDAEGVTVALHYKVTNPNAHGFSLSRVTWALDLEGKPALKGDMPAGLSIPANGSAPLVVPVRVRWRDVPDVVQLVATRREVAFSVRGSAAVSTPVGDLEVPFSREGRLEIPRLPTFAIEGLRVRELSATGVALDLRLRIGNSNRFPLPVGALAYGLRLDGSEVASGRARPDAAVPAGGSATVTIPIHLSLAGAGAALQRLLVGGDVPVEVRGSADFGGLELPFEAGR